MDQEKWRNKILELHSGGMTTKLLSILSEASSENWGKPVDGRDLSNMNLQGLKLRGLKLSFAILSGADFCRAILENVEFISVKAERINLAESKIQGVLDGTFDYACFRAADLHKLALGGSFKHADFYGTNLKEANFGMASTFEGADFTKSFLGSSDEQSFLGYQGEAVCFRGACFLEADMGGIDLRIADFSGADFSEANLENAAFTPGEEQTVSNFNAACLRKVNAQRADFHWADMQDCDFSGADLTQASLEGCDLRGSNLANSKLDGTNLINAKASLNTSWPDNFDPQKAGVIYV